MEENNITPDVEEQTTVEETVDEVTAEPQETETQEEQTQAFLTGQYNKEEVSWTKEQAQELAQKGMNYDKVQEKLSNYENNEGYKWLQDYAKNKGFDDLNKFAEAARAEEKERQHQDMINSYKSKFGAEAAEEMASMKRELDDIKQYNDSTKAEQAKNKELTDFMSWHNTKHEQGIFTESFDANNVPQEIWDMRNDGMSWKEAYTEHTLSNINNIKTQTEQNTLKKLNEKNQASTGSIQEGNQSDEEKWSFDFIEAQAKEKGSSWVNKNYAKIDKSGYFKQ